MHEDDQIFIRFRKKECEDYLGEAIASESLDLMDRLSAAMCDVMVVWRRRQKQEPGKPIEHFTNEELRDSAYWEGDLL